MINAIINGIFNLTQSFVYTITAPINALLVPIVPTGLQQVVATIPSLLNYVSNILGYFLSLLPPLFRIFLGVLLTFYVVAWPVSFAIENIDRALKLIQKLKFW